MASPKSGGPNKTPAGRSPKRGGPLRSTTKPPAKSSTFVSRVKKNLPTVLKTVKDAVFDSSKANLPSFSDKKRPKQSSTILRFLEGPAIGGMSAHHPPRVRSKKKIKKVIKS
jgi:hypothetical protein